VKPVLICAPGADIRDSGSMTRFLKHVAESLGERGCMTIILGARELAQAMRDDATLRFLQRVRLPWLATYWVLAFKLWIGAGRPVIVVISQEYVLPFAFSKQIPIYHDVIQYFIPRNKKSALFYRYYLPWVTKKLEFVYCVTDATGRMVQRLMGKVNYSVCGVPIEKAFSFPTEADESEERFRFIWVGTLAEHKNYRRALGYMNDTHAAHTKMAMVVPKNQQAVLQAEIAALGLADRISVFSNLTEKRLAELYLHSDLVLSTSTLEGFCMPVLEAALCGCKPMVPNRGAFRENFGRFAILVPPHSSGVDFNTLDADSAPVLDRAAVRESARDLHQVVLKSSVRAMDEIASAALVGHKDTLFRKYGSLS
jgi:glycosyltransferase involved in cell wall biosynthesis